MLQIVRIEGTQPIIMHSAAGMDPSTPANIERGEIKESVDPTELLQTKSDSGSSTASQASGSTLKDGLPSAGSVPFLYRNCCAEELRQGPQVREGLVVLGSRFEYDAGRYGETIDDLIKNCQFTVPV